MSRASQPDLLGPKSDAVAGARLLLEPRERRRRRQFLVEGKAGIEAALAAGWVEALYLTPAAAELAAPGIRVYWVSPAGLKALSETVTPQGGVAVCRRPEVDLAQTLASADRVVVCAGVADPGNLGTIVRTALAFGYDAVLVTTGSADPWSGKVLRSTAGAFAAIPVLDALAEPELPTALAAAGLSVLVAAGGGRRKLSEVEAELAGRHAWVLGSEAHGVADLWLEFDPVRIPMAAAAESLNVAAAAAVCLFAGRPEGLS